MRAWQAKGRCLRGRPLKSWMKIMEDDTRFQGQDQTTASDGQRWREAVIRLTPKNRNQRLQKAQSKKKYAGESEVRYVFYYFYFEFLALYPDISELYLSNIFITLSLGEYWRRKLEKNNTFFFLVGFCCTVLYRLEKLLSWIPLKYWKIPGENFSSDKKLNFKQRTIIL